MTWREFAKLILAPKRRRRVVKGNPDEPSYLQTAERWLHIWVYSEPDKGTTFKLYFPQVAEGVSDIVAGSGDQAALQGNETVLVVEDEKPVRDLTVRMLRQLGYSVLSAASGAEAIEISQSFAGRISLLLTDVVMPQMSGRQVAEALIVTRPDMKVLYLSGYTEDTVIHHGIQSGVEFLPKPFSREALSKKLGEMTKAGGGSFAR